MRDPKELLRYIQEGGSYRVQKVSEQSLRYQWLDVGRITYWVLSKAKGNPEFEYYYFLKQSLSGYSYPEKFLEGFVAELEADRDYTALDTFVEVSNEINPGRELALLDQSLWADYVQYYLKHNSHVLIRGGVHKDLEKRGIRLREARPKYLAKVLLLILSNPLCQDEIRKELAKVVASHLEASSVVRMIPYDYLFFHFVVYFLVIGYKLRGEARVLVEEFGYDERFDPFLFERKRYENELRHIQGTESGEDSPGSAYEASRSSTEESPYSELDEEWSSSREDYDSGGWEPSYW